MQERERCGQSRNGMVCDRWRDHDGDHRGYNEQIDEAMFWSTEVPPTMDEMQATYDAFCAAVDREDLLGAQVYAAVCADHVAKLLKAKRLEGPRRTVVIERIVQRVAELPDRTSPDDWPEAMLVTSGELAWILSEELTP